LRLQAADRPLTTAPKGAAARGAVPALLEFRSPSACLHCFGIAVLLERSLHTLSLDDALTRHHVATCRPRELGSRGLPWAAGARHPLAGASHDPLTEFRLLQSLTTCRRPHQCAAAYAVPPSRFLAPSAFEDREIHSTPGFAFPGTFRLQVFSTSWRLAPSRSLRPCFMPVTLLGFVPSELSPHAKS